MKEMGVYFVIFEREGTDSWIGDRFVQLLSLIPILILLLYLIVSKDIAYTGTCGLGIWNLFQRRTTVF